jgi:cytochrome c-type biogenesis protein
MLGALIAIVLLVAILGEMTGQAELSSKVLTLALPALAAGALSVLSPCSLPIVLGYFSVAFQEQRDRIVLVTLAFLGGVGVTMTVLGASFTALGSLAIDEQARISLIGGLLVIGFGVMSFFGKGFSGLKLTRSSNLGAGGAFFYGLIFAFGWTACVGPILGSVLTLLLAEGSTTSGALSLVAGGVLSMIYVLGLGLPIFLLVLALKGGGNHREVSRLLRGRSFTHSIGGRTLFLHSTAMISGLLLIGLGVLLATGQMTMLSQELAGSRLAQLGVEIEGWIPGS